jgi:putative transposase
MTRYYFNVKDGKTLLDNEGHECATLAEARKLAIEHSGEILKDGASDLTWPALFGPSFVRNWAWKGALVMPKKRFSAEQIVTVLRQIEVLMSQGKAAPVACREAGISQQSYYRWRKEYGGLELDQARRMKDLERENVRLKRLVADLSLEKQVLKDVAAGNL